jgi:ubiquitin carboxyl-terminal hydrolase 34
LFSACLKDIPDHLIFNLKRFDFDITTMTRCKVNDEFRFPLSIDMAPYNVESLSNPEDAIPPDMFELVGVLVHSGTAESGHYYSYIRERPTPRPACDSWVQFNDIDVSVFDSQRIADCCYGGVELTSTLHLSKSHNAYMLFYQRVSSIKRFEAVYGKHDPANPVRLPFSPTIMAEIGVQNQSTIRSYCLQDPSHARFMRLMLERMQGSPNRECSSDHITEGKMIRHSLDYIQQISCRFKEMPEFETCCKLLQDCGQQCYDCASHIASFFASTDFMDVEVRKESVLRSAILRNPAQLVRRSFASMLCEALRTMRKGINEADLDPQLGTAREAEYRHTFTSCIGNLAEPWVDMHKFGRAWNDYFDLLSRLTNLGIWEVGIVLQHGFLEKLGQVIWADVRHDPMDLRARYASYVNLREKGRLFGLTGLIALLSSLLESVHFHVGCEADQPRSPNRDGFYELSTYEMQLLRPSKLGPKQKPAFEWLRKIIVSRQNPNAVTKIISTLLQEPMLALPLEITLAAGLSSEAVGEATAFLDPAIAFCTFCKNPALVQLLVRDALGQIDSIGGTFGKEHLDFVIELSDVENEAASLSKRDFSTMVFKSLKSWAPTLLLYPDDIHYDIRGDTVRFLRERLFDPLQNADLNPDQEDALRRHVRALAKACILHIQQNHIPRAGKQITAIEMGQAHQITRVIHHICHGYFTNGDAADDHFVAEATATLERLQTLTQEAAEAASEDWADNDSVAASDSDNPDSQEWAEPT